MHDLEKEKKGRNGKFTSTCLATFIGGCWIHKGAPRQSKMAICHGEFCIPLDTSFDDDYYISY